MSLREDLLSWLGLRRGDGYPNIDALMRDLRRALPNDESVLLRYIATVVVLLGRVAWADGEVTRMEEENLRALLSHIEGLGPGGVDAVCEVLHGKIPSLSDSEMELVYTELRSLCDGNERKQVMRLLVHIAAVDGRLSDPERHELSKISEELGVSLAEVEAEPIEPAHPASDEPTEDEPAHAASDEPTEDEPAHAASDEPTDAPPAEDEPAHIASDEPTGGDPAHAANDEPTTTEHAQGEPAPAGAPSGQDALEELEHEKDDRV
ncbi:MAG: TerB family tellurite resistance protein [Polyangiaceae bacterium]